MKAIQARSVSQLDGSRLPIAIVEGLLEIESLL